MATMTRWIPRVRPIERRLSKLARHEMKWGLLFISPWLFGLLAFTLLPTLATFAMSFTNFNLVNASDFRFVGFANYGKMVRDPVVPRSLWITIRFLLMTAPVGIVAPLALAALLNSKHLVVKPIFRTLFYMPYIVPLVSAVFIWGGVLNENTGWLNRGLENVGVRGPSWLNSTTWVYPGLILIGLWGIGNAMLTMLAGMQGVPTELYDAARVDGAGPVRSFFVITIPLISPVIFYNLVLILIGSFQYFLVPWVLLGPEGNPGGATMFFNMYLFKQFFTYQDMAYGATLAWLLFLIVLAVTLLVFGTARYWVYYAAGER